MHQSSYDRMTAFKEKYLRPLTNEYLSILDLGSMDVNGSYREIFRNPRWRYRGMDASPGKNVDIVLKTPYDWKEIPTGSTDVLISGQAFEHIEFFWITMLEVARVLKPGGLCCIIAPSAGPEHRYPVDCWRIYPDGCAALAKFAKLALLEASTQWDADDRYDEDSKPWRDTVMVAKKRRLPLFFALRNRIWRAVIHRVLIQRL